MLSILFFFNISIIYIKLAFKTLPPPQLDCLKGNLSLQLVSKEFIPKYFLSNVTLKALSLYKQIISRWTQIFQYTTADKRLLTVSG